MKTSKKISKFIENNEYAQLTIFFAIVFVLFLVLNIIFSWEKSTLFIFISTVVFLVFLFTAFYLFELYSQLSNRNSMKRHILMLNLIKTKNLIHSKPSKWKFENKLQALQHITTVRQRRINAIRGISHKMKEYISKKEKDLAKQQENQLVDGIQLKYQKRIQNRICDRQLKEIERNKMNLTKLEEVLSGLLAIQKNTNDVLRKFNNNEEKNKFRKYKKEKTLNSEWDKNNYIDTIMEINLLTPLNVNYTKVDLNNYEIADFENVYNKILSSLMKIKNIDRNKNNQ